jgi:hypothetical protein
VEQLSRHVVLAVELLVAIAALVGTAPGTTHELRQFATSEPHVIMQVVVVEVCASRIGFAAAMSDTVPVSPATANTMVKARMENLRATLIRRS